MRDTRWSHYFFAITLAALGLIGLVRGDFLPMWDGIPDGMAGYTFLAYATATLSLLAGAGLLVPRTGTIAAKVLLIAFGAWLVLVHLPYLILHPIGVGAWWGTGDTAVMTAAAWSLWGGPRQRIAKVLFGLGLIPFGIAHFAYLDRTIEFVPHWLPWPTAIAYATGAAFIAAGIAICAKALDRLAAALAALQIVGFTVIVWIPILLGHPKPYDFVEFYNSWALSAAAWVVAASYPGDRWFPSRRAA